ncbi:MAG: hypothetical protein QM657_11365 [Lacrimispora sp.]|uniref:hypothetical protein n=1 Tax=Lacrimispora sp. TaxID=2719234 RepID=UPI0039E53E17
MLKRRKCIEATIKNIFKFFTILFCTLLVYMFYLVEVIGTNGHEWKINVINTVFLLVLFFSISGLIKEIRIFSDEGGMELKAIYEVFLILFIVITGCSYNIEKIKETLNLFGLNNIFIGEKVTMYTVVSYLYQSLFIIKTAIELVTVKDIVFQINGWNLNKTIKEYWNELLENHKIYILHEDQHKKNPRLWAIRGDSCIDIIDDLQKCKVYESHKEYIKLTDSEAGEILRKRKSKGFDDGDIYEGDSASIFTPWKSEHFYSISIRLIDLSYYEEELIRELMYDNKEMIQILPSSVKSCKSKNYWEIFKNKLKNSIDNSI